MATYKLTLEAESDLDRIWLRGLKEFGAEQAEQPHKYQLVDNIREEYRRSPCGVDSIYYRVIGDDVEIMSIIGRQDVEEWL